MNKIKPMLKLTQTISKQIWLINGGLLIIALLVFLSINKGNDSTSTRPVVTASGIPVMVDISRLPTYTPQPTDTPEQVAATVSAVLPTPTPSILPTITQVMTSEEVIDTPPTKSVPETCEHPKGWTIHHVEEGDTLFAFQLGAGRADNPATVEEIAVANCLDTSFLTIGQTLWLPEGAAEHAPSSQPVAPQLPAGVSRTANCPCTITVHEGWRIEQIADEINRTQVAFSGADFLAYTRRGAPIPGRSFLATVPPDGGLEGFMFPGTYTLQNDTTAEQFRDMLLDQFEVNAAGLLNAAGNHGITPYELVILASIIQRESWSAQEQPLVSSVFHNRRKAGKGFGATVTVMYALGGPADWWPHPRAGQMSLDTPYNTNIYLGFPPTPISNPGLSALQAAANPAQTSYMYFTGSCSGSGNAYASTYEEHLQNVRCE